MRGVKRRQRILALAIIGALFASLVLAASSGFAVVDREMLFNGNFESGFATIPGCGVVGRGWGCFTNGGSIVYGFFDDQWAPVVADGKHSQLMELDTMQYAASETDRYAGIFQTLFVVPGGNYQLQIQGLMRETQPNPAEDQWRYRVQWGYTTDGSTDWTLVNNWTELPWDKIDERTSPTGLESYSTTFSPSTSKITLFFRVWKKWGTAYKDLDVNVDAISLFGPGNLLAAKQPAQPAAPVKVVPPTAQPAAAPVNVPAQPEAPVQPAPAQPEAPVQVLPQPAQPAAPAQVLPVGPSLPAGAQQAGVCTGYNYIHNGNFESGFVQYPAATVGANWSFFNNNGQANYGYYDEQWTRVIQDGAHGQLLEINTNNMPQPGDANRVNGIYQVVTGLTPGATYEFAMWGLMREANADPNADPGRYRMQWGYALGGSAVNIVNWTDIPWNVVYDRLNPGPMLPFSVQFQAPSSSLVIGIRAVKKSADANLELDVNVDAIRLSASAAPPVAVQPCLAPCQQPVACGGAGPCGGSVAYSGNPAPVGQAGVVIVTSGGGNPGYDWNPGYGGNPAYGGQPGAVVVGGGAGYRPANVSGGAAPASACTWYTVKRGDSLGAVASRYHTSIGSLMKANGIANANRIKAGQKLCIR
jgi:hypothetical protein